ncbi:MAG TPA: hypothetical protein GYA07_13725 [Verrucomicrobia bacterium]|nr:hypothetical protein [Verrucomicrobiota bacterium]HOB32924.1 hypothetical protein [Verrucomicrobiota bacterium]HOP97135.1 hypothetical protein [Verrucomicrobiota bacterium]HPU55368.1 hypothetical protein [Verrucomicrobiota bacterium]
MEGRIVFVVVLSLLTAVACKRASEQGRDSVTPVVPAKGRIEMLAYDRIESMHPFCLRVEKWALTNGYNFRTTFVDRAGGSEAARLLKVERFPAIVVFDPEDREIARAEGTLAIEAFIQE